MRTDTGRFPPDRAQSIGCTFPFRDERETSAQDAEETARQTDLNVMDPTVRVLASICCSIVCVCFRLHRTRFVIQPTMTIHFGANAAASANRTHLLSAALR